MGASSQVWVVLTVWVYIHHGEEQDAGGVLPVQRKTHVHVAPGGAVQLGIYAPGGTNDEVHGMATIYICHGETVRGRGSAFGVG